MKPYSVKPSLENTLTKNLVSYLKKGDRLEIIKWNKNCTQVIAHYVAAYLNNYGYTLCLDGRNNLSIIYIAPWIQKYTISNEIQIKESDYNQIELTYINAQTIKQYADKLLGKQAIEWAQNIAKNYNKEKGKIIDTSLKAKTTEAESLSFKKLQTNIDLYEKQVNYLINQDLKKDTKVPTEEPITDILDLLD